MCFTRSLLAQQVRLTGFLKSLCVNNQYRAQTISMTLSIKCRCELNFMLAKFIAISFAVREAKSKCLREHIMRITRKNYVVPVRRCKSSQRRKDVLAVSKQKIIGKFTEIPVDEPIQQSQEASMCLHADRYEACAIFGRTVTHVLQTQRTPVKYQSYYF